MRPISWRRYLLGVAVVAAIDHLAITGVDAHKGITSKYTYNDDVFPILRDKCGRCHVDGGIAPMSLMVYGLPGGAAAWAESMRERLVAEAMPPWSVDPTGPAVRGGRALSARELDTLVTWAAGGAPQGDLNHTPAPMVAHPQWTLGQPDLTIPIPREVTLGLGQMESVIDFAIANPLTQTKWVRAADLLPGTPSIVRSATIGIENGPVLAVWEPGDEAVNTPGGTAFKWPAGATLNVHIRYKKGWQDEQQVRTDRSTIGVYFTDEPLSPESIQTVVVDRALREGDATEPRIVRSTLIRSARVLAIRPVVDQPYASMAVAAVTSSGRRVPLLKLRGIRPEWPRRYWLVDPTELPAGTTIDVTATRGEREPNPSLASLKIPFHIMLDVVSR